MSELTNLIATAADKSAFLSIQDYIDFSLRFLEYIASNKQAEIVAQNDIAYRFYQFNEEAAFKITRPYNKALLYTIRNAEAKYRTLNKYLARLRKHRGDATIDDCQVINKAIYTLQQTIGFALDAGTAMGVEPNVARKLNGDLFERLIYLVILAIGLRCRSGVVNIPVKIEGHTMFNMSYQHDLIVENDKDELCMIGSVKTTSKDRVDKIFIDKFLYCKLTDTSVPHIAVFLHDVQRKKTKKVNEFGINTTFLAGHFKGYTVKLNPLDGVYYFDLRPNMTTDSILKEQISTFDNLLCSDIWKHIADP